MVKKAVYENMIRRIRELEWQNEDLLQSVARITEGDQGKRFSKVRALVRVSMEVMAEISVDGVLQRVVNGAREVTGSNIASSGYGYREGIFEAGAASRSEDCPTCPPDEVFCVSRGRVYMDLSNERESIRLSEEELRSHPVLRGLPEGRAPHGVGHLPEDRGTAPRNH